ncbi:MAG TPA: alpha-galactosidase [Acidobacteriaceae bacterium]|nr:alpha-galactosidase [Acidobacteriaceae bacterium]
MSRSAVAASLAGVLAAALGLPAHTAPLSPRATLATADVTLEFAAEPSAPQLLSLCGRNGDLWSNGSPEPLPGSILRNGQHLPVVWHSVPAATVATPRRIAFVYESQQPHLRLTWQWTARAAFGPVEHSIVIENLTADEYWLPIPDTLALAFAIPASANLHQLYIEKGAGAPSSIGTHLLSIPAGYSWTGRSTTFAHPILDEPREIIPYTAVFRSNPASSGPISSGWFAGIDFSGRTRIALRRSPQSLVAQLGLDPTPAPALTRLTPGGSFTAPSVFLGAFTGGPDGAGNQLRPWVRAVLGSPRAWADPHYPLVVDNSWGVGMNINETSARAMIADSAALGFEMFHLDAGWFRGVGDWYPNPAKFPHGLAALADDAHAHGERFGLWTDWTQAGLDTELGALNLRDPKVRDWLVVDVPANWKPQDFKGQTIDLGVPAAADYASREVDRIVASDKLDMLEHDGYLVAQGCTRNDHPHAAPDPHNTTVEHYDGEDIVLSSNSTDVSYHAVRAYYRIYERLRRDHPGLLLEICNDGGRMVDFGSAAHGDYFSITDSYDPLSNRRAFYDASYILPPAMLETYVDKWPTPAIASFLYELRSGMMGWLSVMQDTNNWTPEQHAAARDAIALYKTRLRPLIRDAQLFHIAPRPDGIHWDGIQYYATAHEQGVVYAFRGSAPGNPTHRYVLAGLDPRATYRLHFQDGSSPDTSASGRDLMTAGLTVTLTAPLTSELVFFNRQHQAPTATHPGLQPASSHRLR